MKRLLKNNICLVLALAIIMSLFSCVFSLGAAAEETNYSDTAYLISYNNVPDTKYYTFSKDTWGASGKTVKISFKYYLKNAKDKELYFTNIAGGGDFADDTTNDRYLYSGEHSYSYTTDSYSRSGFCFAAAVTGVTASNAQLYIWDVVIELGGNDMFTGITPGYGTDDNCTIENITYEDVVNAKPAYLISYNNVPDTKYYTFSKDTWGASGKTVKISFKYYLKNAKDKELYFTNIAGGGDFADDTTNDRYLYSGEHSYSYTTDSYSRSGFCFAAAVTGVTASNAQLYIWDVVIELGGNNMFTGIKPGYGTNDNCSISEITYEDVLNSKVAHKISFKDKPIGSRWFSIVTDKSVSNKAVNISFKYSLINASEGEVVLKSIATGHEIPDAATGNGKLLPGKHSFSYSTEQYSGSTCIAVSISDKYENISSDAEIYIWDIDITVDGANQFNVNSFQMSGDALVRKPDYTEVTYNDVVLAQSAYEFDFSGRPTGISSYFVIGADKYPSNAEIEISFKYYLADAQDGELYISNLAGNPSGDFKDNIKGTSSLYAGRNSFSFKATGYSGSTCATVSKSDENASTNAKLYIWDVKMTSNGSNIFDVENYQPCGVDGIPGFTELSYGDIPFAGDANNDGTVNIIDLVRLKKHIANGDVVNRKNSNIVTDSAIDGLDLAALRKILLTPAVNTVSELKMIYLNGRKYADFESGKTEYVYYQLGDKIPTVSAVKTAGTGTLSVKQASAINEKAFIALNGKTYTVEFRNAPEAYSAFYRNADGMTVREITLNSLLGGDAVDVFQMSDVHFNYCNQQDMEENNPTVMSTLKNRTQNANGSNLALTEKCIGYGANADQMVFTGDIMDYLSYGNLELLQNSIWNKYPNALVTLGNHDSARAVGLPTDVKDETTVESRYEILQKNWKHNIYYTSKVIKNKVMIIQMDNGMFKFWDNQVEQLKNDIKTAKENNYTVLLFVHVPLATGNEADLNKKAFYIGDPVSATDNFYSGAYTVVGYNSTGATKEVYDIITNNADIIKGVFCGHEHCDYYTEISAKTSAGQSAYIPQFTMSASFLDGGAITKITVK